MKTKSSESTDDAQTIGNFCTINFYITSILSSFNFCVINFSCQIFEKQLATLV